MNIIDVINKIISNLEICKKFIQLNSNQEIYNFLCKYNYNKTYEEFCSELQKIKAKPRIYR